MAPTSVSHAEAHTRACRFTLLLEESGRGHPCPHAFASVPAAPRVPPSDRPGAGTGGLGRPSRLGALALSRGPAGPRAPRLRPGEGAFAAVPASPARRRAHA